MRNVVLAAAAVVLPHHGKPQSIDSKVSRPAVPAVSTTVETAAALPPEHAYDEFIREASMTYRVDAALIRSVMQTESAFDALAELHDELDVDRHRPAQQRGALPVAFALPGLNRARHCSRRRRRTGSAH